METGIRHDYAGKSKIGPWRRKTTQLIQNGNRHEFSKITSAGILQLAATINSLGHQMSENLLQTLQQLVQDVIAPDVRELKVRVASLEKQMDVRFDAVDVRFNALEQKMDAQFNALLAAIGESKPQSELTTMRLIAP